MAPQDGFVSGRVEVLYNGVWGTAGHVSVCRSHAGL